MSDFNKQAMMMVLNSVADALLPADKALTAVSQMPSPHVAGAAVYLFADKGMDKLLLVFDKYNLLIDFDGIVVCDLIDNCHEVLTGGVTTSRVKTNTARAIGRSIVGEVLGGDRGAFIGAMTTGVDVETTTTPVVSRIVGNCIVRFGLCDEHAANLELDFGTDTKLAYGVASLVNTVLQQHRRRARRASEPKRVGRSFGECVAELENKQRMAEEAREAAMQQRQRYENMALSGQPKKILRRFFSKYDALMLLSVVLGVCVTFTQVYSVYIWMSFSYLFYLAVLLFTLLLPSADLDPQRCDKSFHCGFAVPVLLAHAVINLFPYALSSLDVTTMIYRLTGYPYNMYEGGMVVWLVAAFVELGLLWSVVEMFRGVDRKRFKWGLFSSASVLVVLIVVWLGIGALLPKHGYMPRYELEREFPHKEIVFGSDEQEKKYREEERREVIEKAEAMQRYNDSIDSVWVVRDAERKQNGFEH